VPLLVSLTRKRVIYLALELNRSWTDTNGQFNQILPEVAPIERNQEVVMKPDESLSPSLFTFCSQFIAFCRD